MADSASSASRASLASAHASFFTGCRAPPAAALAACCAPSPLLLLLVAAAVAAASLSLLLSPLPPPPLPPLLPLLSAAPVPAGLLRLRSALPASLLLPVGKLVTMVQNRAGNAPLFRDVAGTLADMLHMLRDDKYAGLCRQLLPLLHSAQSAAVPRQAQSIPHSVGPSRCPMSLRREPLHVASWRRTFGGRALSGCRQTTVPAGWRRSQRSAPAGAVRCSTEEAPKSPRRREGSAPWRRAPSRQDQEPEPKNLRKKHLGGGSSNSFGSIRGSVAGV